MKGLVKLIAFCLVAIAGESCSGKFIFSCDGDIWHSDFRAGGKYLILPVEDGAPECRIFLESEDSVLESLVLRPAMGQVDYYVPLNLGKYDRDSFRFVMSSEPSRLFAEKLHFSDRFIPDKDPLRPVFHHTAPYGWINDPNGLIYIDGMYHLFYQHNPYGCTWGNMTWGHSVSRDLIDWEDWGDAVFPDANGTAFSGCCLIDEHDCAGFGEGTLVAAYTADAPSGQTQCLAYSTDGGRHFEKYSGNPVLASDTERDFRDPKVFWHDASGQWIMLLGAGKKIEFYNSANLVDWKLAGVFDDGGRPDDSLVWECPDLFELTIADAGERVWVLMFSTLVNEGSSSRVRYYTGNFDGRSFVADSPGRPVDFGPDFYAASTWENAPSGRRLMTAWLCGVAYGRQQPTRVFRGVHTVPRELGLKSVGKRRILTASPCMGLNEYMNRVASYNMIRVNPDSHFRKVCRGSRAFSLDLNISSGDADFYTITLFNEAGEAVEFVMDCHSGQMQINREKSGRTDFSDRFVGNWSLRPGKMENLRLRILVDSTSIECFVNDGAETVTFQIYPSEPYGSVSVCAKGGEAMINSMDVYTITK